jgi:hypothetical protein
MKPPKIIINGVSLDDVRTPQRRIYASNTRTFIGLPRHDFREEGEQFLLTMHPLTAAQLYYDGVLPQDRAQPVELQIGRRKASSWHILTMECGEGQWQERLVVFRFERA